MDTKRQRVLDSLTELNMKKSYSNRILSTPVDMERLANNPISDTQANAVREKYNIKYFKSRDEFNFNYVDIATQNIIKSMNVEGVKYKSIDRKESFINKRVDDLLDIWWERYTKRENLIRSGQYEELRSDMFREKYLEHLKLGNVDSDVIANIERLSRKEWDLLSSYPNAEVDDIRKTQLPSISDIYSYETESTKYKEVKEDIVKAFNEVGLQYDKDLGKDEQPDVIKRRKFRSLADRVEEGTISIDFNRKGGIAVPYIGSTDNPRTKDITQEFLDYLDNHNIDY